MTAPDAPPSRSEASVDLGVAYNEDPDEVAEVLRQIGAELQADPSHGLWSEGRGEQVKGNLKQAAEKVKDAFKKD